jgi:hypothetical protein
VLIIWESSLSAFLLTALHFIYLDITLAYHNFLHLLSTNHKCTQPCYFSLLLRRRRWTGILQWGVLGYVLPRLPFLWSNGVFRYSVSLRVVIVFRDIIYVIIIPYSWHLVICDYFCPYVWNIWSWVMHTMSTWFWHKTGYDKSGTRAVSTVGTLA